MPDFAQVYSFIGSVFDPNTTGHLQKLKEMGPIDVETVSPLSNMYGIFYIIITEAWSPFICAQQIFLFI